jgi:hypothetical protein
MHLCGAGVRQQLLYPGTPVCNGEGGSQRMGLLKGPRAGLFYGDFRVSKRLCRPAHRAVSTAVQSAFGPHRPCRTGWDA